MERAFRVEPYRLSSDTYMLRTCTPVPGVGILPVNAFLIQAAQPVLVDTGMTGDRETYMAALRSVIDTGLIDSESQALFCVDCFGALLSEPAESAADIPPTDLQNGMIIWSTADTPWLAMVEEQALSRSLKAVRELEPSVILSSHLPPAIGVTDTLVEHLAAARLAAPFVGPDQAAFEQMMAGAPTR